MTLAKLIKLRDYLDNTHEILQKTKFTTSSIEFMASIKQAIRLTNEKIGELTKDAL